MEDKERTNLHLNVQHHNPPPSRQLPNHLLTRAVPIPAKLRMLHEPVLRNHLLERRHVRVVVIDIARLAWSGFARCVGDGGCECGGVSVEEEFVQCAFADA